MTPIIGYSNTRVNSIDSSQTKNDDFAKWLHSPNYKAVKGAANTQGSDTNNNRNKSFASYVQDAAAAKESPVALRIQNRINLTDIEV